MAVDLKKIRTFATPYLISISVGSVFLGIALTIFAWFGKPTVFIIFLPAVMISAWYGGIKSGFFTALLSTPLIYYFFTFPYYSFSPKSPVSVVQTVIFLIEAIVICYVIDSGHRNEKIILYKTKEKENKKLIENLQKELLLAKQQTAQRDEFLAIASHELKTPLTTVLLQIQTTLHNIRNVSLSEFSVEHLLKMLQSMQSQTKRLSKMINDLLNISLITTHKMELEIEDVDLTTLVEDVVENFREKLEKEDLRINLQAKDTILGKWDKLRLEQVFDNLISNAIKYGNKKPIYISIEKQNSIAVIRIIDNGIGIKNSEKENIFLLFKRGNVEKDYKGLGIGLYIAQQIILLHGGRIELNSNPGEGSIFTIFLPISHS